MCHCYSGEKCLPYTKQSSDEDNFQDLACLLTARSFVQVCHSFIESTQRKEIIRMLTIDNYTSMVPVLTPIVRGF